MKNILKRVIAVLVAVLSVIAFSSCSDENEKTVVSTEADYYIKINDEQVDKEYIGYFFYLAQRNMLEEAGWKTGEGGNATEEDINRYWQTTEIDGKDAVDAARNLAADNAVRQKIQYYKAIEEGISLSDDEKFDISAQLEATIANNGGKKNFEKALGDMDTDMEAYRQIITENMYAQKLYDKFDAQGDFELSDDELAEFTEKNIDKIPPDDMYDSAKKQKFNDMVTLWEKDFAIEINDSKMNEFKV